MQRQPAAATWDMKAIEGSNSKGRGIKLAAVMALCLLANSIQAAILTTSVHGSLAPASTDYDEQPISVAGFDPSWGTLQSVTVSMTGTGQFVQQYENTGSKPATLQWTADKLDLLLQWPDMATTLFNLTQNEAHDYATGAYDGKTDFAGSSGGTETIMVSASKTRKFTSPTLLSQLEGPGTKTLYLTGTASQVEHGPANTVMIATLTAGADITVTYNYAPVPEPGTWLSAGCAVLGLGLSLRRRLPRACSSGGLCQTGPV